MKKQTFTCQHCGYTFEQEPSKQEIEFAKKTGSKSLFAVWLCPKCGTDNTAEIETSDE